MPQTTIIIKGNSKSATKAIRNTNTALKKNKRAVKQSNAAAKNMVPTWLGATAVVLGAVTALKASLTAYAEQERQQITLAAAMKQAGTFTEAAFQHNLEYASSLQSMTTFGDEAILGVQKMLTNFKLEGKALDDVTKATLDLAAAKGMDLKVAADLVAKSVGSSTNAMTRYGIEVTGAVGSTERAESAVKNITKLFGGAAAAEAESFGGQIKQLKNTFGDLMELLGEKFAPIVSDVGKILKKIADSLKGNKEAIDIVWDLIKAFTPLLQVAEDTQKAIQAFPKMFNNMRDAITNAFIIAKVQFKNFLSMFPSAKALVIAWAGVVKAKIRGIFPGADKGAVNRAQHNFRRALNSMLRATKKFNVSRLQMHNLYGLKLTEAEMKKYKLIEDIEEGHNVKGQDRLNSKTQAQIDAAQKAKEARMQAQIQFNEFMGEQEEAEVLKQELATEKLLLDAQLTIDQKALIEEQGMKKIDDIRIEYADAETERNKTLLEKVQDNFKKQAASAKKAFESMTVISETFVTLLSKGVEDYLKGGYKGMLSGMVIGWGDMLAGIAEMMAKQKFIQGLAASLNPLEAPLAAGYFSGATALSIGAGLIRGIAQGAASKILGAQSGADFIVKEPTMMMVGEVGAEHVKVTPAPIEGSAAGSIIIEQINISVANPEEMEDGIIEILESIADRTGRQLLPRPA